jgi:hypothetical protein
MLKVQCSQLGRKKREKLNLKVINNDLHSLCRKSRGYFQNIMLLTKVFYTPFSVLLHILVFVLFVNWTKIFLRERHKLGVAPLNGIKTLKIV